MMVDDVSFDVRAGEIVGIAGVAGNGQSELIEAIAGIRRADRRRASMLDGKAIDVAGRADPASCATAGLAHVPEDRHHVGLVLPFEENENSILGYHDEPHYLNGPFLDIEAIRNDADEKIEQIRHPPAELPAEDGQFFRRQPAEDRAGARDGAGPRRADRRPADARRRCRRDRIHPQAAHRHARAGKAVLLVSVELDEIRSLSDRILVMFAGRVVGERGPRRPRARSAC